ncbi:MAG: gamma carbonic anhydrase family protein [Pseudomonadota bacterium]
MRYSFEGHSPICPTASWIAPNATLIGKVILHDESSVWWGAVLRGDNEPISVGQGSNIQDNAVLHTDPGYPLKIGTGVTVGHLAMLHGCTIGDDCLIGMGAVVLNGASIGAGTIIGAGALVPAKKPIPEGSLVVGQPGRVVRSVKPHEVDMICANARHYQAQWKRFQDSLHPCSQFGPE